MNKETQLVMVGAIVLLGVYLYKQNAGRLDSVVNTPSNTQTASTGGGTQSVAPATVFNNVVGLVKDIFDSTKPAAAVSPQRA